MMSRRTLLQQATTVAASPLLAAPAAAAPEAVAFIGGYAPESAGIQSLSGQLLAANPHNPSWLQFAPGGRQLYAVNEQAAGSVSSYAVGPDGQTLSLLATVPSGGAGPVHLSLHPGGRHAFVAHYGSGHLAVLPVAEDGRLQPPSQIVPAAAASPGRTAHAHMALADASGRFVLATDLGLDLLTVWRFDARRGLLSEPQRHTLAAGSGPRHLAFHPRLPQQLYLLNEQASTLVWFGFDPASGRLQQRAVLSCLPAGFSGRSYASDLRFSPDGRHLYTLNRLHDAIAIFAIGEDGQPRWQGEEWTRGSYPRACALDARGEHLYVCNQRSHQLTVFRLTADGGLQFTGRYLPAGSPAVIAFAAAT